MNKADYKDQPIEEYRNNPLIEALPFSFLTKEERSDLFISRNIITEADRKLSSELRVSKLSNISKIFIPTNWGLHLSQNLDLLIREGYRRRNPLRNDHIRTAYKVSTGALNDLPDLGDPVGSTFLIGHSGMGKTTTVRKYLSNYPQVIEHDRYGPVPLRLYQIVYLYIDAPPDGSVKNFCMQFLNAIDEATGSDHYEENRRSSIGYLSTLIAKLCSLYHVGLIVIDECQNLLRGNYGKERIHEFLNVLSNKIGCPLCFIGTPASQELLNGTFHLCRRFERRGSITLKPYIKDSRDWKSFIQILWQDGLYLDGDNHLTEELFDALYEASAGIPAVAKDVFYELQRILLEDPAREEKITSDLLRQVSRENFPNIENKVTAILHNDFTSLSAMGDGLIASGYKQPETKDKIRKDRQVGQVDKIYALLKQIGYREHFTETELRQQAQLIALETEPTVSGVELTAKILEFMKVLVEKKREQPSEEIAPANLDESIVPIDQLL